MPAYRKASIRQLQRQAQQLEGKSLQGILHRDAEGRWYVGDRPLESFLVAYEGEAMTLIAIANESDRPMEKKVCPTCGREYIGTSCPYCRMARLRLRGRG